MSSEGTTTELTPDSRLTVRSVSVVPEGSRFVVGDAESATFIVLPEVGVVALRSLAGGASVSEATSAVSTFAGQPVDVAGFAVLLIKSGLVTAVDGRPLDDVPQLAVRKHWLAGIRPESVRPLFSPPAWAVYGLLALTSAALLLTSPQLRPSFEDFFFYPDPALCVLAAITTTVVLTMCHEFCHWLAARAAGVGGRLQVGRRLIFPVLQTDLSQLWSVRKRKRYSPFLAGMAFDTTVLSFCLTFRLSWAHGWISPPPLLVRFAATVVIIQVGALLWQTLVFLRTDLYAVLANLFGCLNLYRTTNLTMRRHLRILRREEVAELEQANPRDLAVARWFWLVYAAGALAVLWYFATITFPGSLLMVKWMSASVLRSSPRSSTFWEALVIGSFSAVRLLTPLVLFTWSRVAARVRS